jgi:hypothetical protein
MHSDLSSIFQVILAEGHIFSEHAGLSGTSLGRARTMVPRDDYSHDHQVPAELLLGENEMT